MSDESAAAILVQTIFTNNEPLRNQMVQAKISNAPNMAANFVKGYFEEMLKMVKTAKTTS